MVPLRSNNQYCVPKFSFVGCVECFLCQKEYLPALSSPHRYCRFTAAIRHHRTFLRVAELCGDAHDHSASASPPSLLNFIGKLVQPFARPCQWHKFTISFYGANVNQNIHSHTDTAFSFHPSILCIKVFLWKGTGNRSFFKKNGFPPLFSPHRCCLFVPAINIVN